MKKKRVIKFISILLIAFFVFQLFPSTLANAEGFEEHAQNSKVILSSGSFNNDALLIGSVNQKLSFHRVPIKNASISMHQIVALDISLNKFFFQQKSFDYRKDIKQAIPHYFNGSKYKNCYFII